MDYLSSSLGSISRDETRAFLYGAASIVLLRAAVGAARPSKTKFIKGPSKEEHKASEYHDDWYPGKRDLATPYGNIRLYEFGPEEGERVLFIHGITTPTPVFTGILPILVDAGYRVATYDLFGRGYSDTPLLDHDDRLYITQILCVLQCLGWTKCSIVGYSLGGGIGSAFASYFPSTVQKLILIAPAGLLAEKDTPLARKIAKSEYVPFVLTDLLQKLYLTKGTESANAAASHKIDTKPVLAWQVKNHRGFPRSYISSFRHAPIFDQWDMYGRLRAQKLDVHAIWGDKDDIVDTQKVSSNLQKAIPEIKLTIVDDVAHDICTSKPDEVAGLIRKILDDSKSG